jgi:peptidoglycan/LPS O-acetylase OafA/YrhL
MPAYTARFNMRYQPALDGLRAVSVLLVLGLHASYGHFPGGWLGVNVFFVLSGFLITSILLDEHARTGALSIKRFYYRRALRLLPALCVALALTGLLWWACGWPGSYSFGALASLFYYSNWIKALGRGVELGAFGHMWSLSVEEQFYLVWPLMIIPLARRLPQAKVLGAVLAGLVLALALGRSALWYAGSPLADYNSTLARADALILGAAIAALFRDERFVTLARSPAGQTAAWLGMLITLVSAGLFDEYRPWLYTYGGLTLFSLAAAAMIASAAAAEHGPFARVLQRSPLVWIGKRSYGLYLYHFALFQALEVLRAPGLANFAWVTAVRFAVTFAVAAASFAWVEQRFLRMKATLAPHDDELAPAK